MIDQSAVLLFITVALASAVEATEALTIILASGITRGWRSTFEGALLALACLAVIVGVAGTPIQTGMAVEFEDPFGNRLGIRLF